MKTKFILVAAFLLSVLTVHAQMPQGSSAPDFTVTDIDGVTHTLSAIGASGKSVGLKFSATWCSPCWTYHNQHHMKNAYENWGPNGTDQIEMFYMESSPSTNEACLYGPSGCVGGTTGDWVTGTPYRIVHLTGANQNLANTYQILGYPTLYAVSPDQRVYWIGSWTQATPSVWEDWLIESFSLDATAVITDSDCGGEGAIDLDRTGGYNGVSYAWSNGQNTEDLTGLDAGMYTVTITDAHGYDIERTFDVSGPSQGPLGVDLLDLEDVSCFQSGDGAIDVIAYGSTGSGYTYDWSNGMTGEYISGLDGGDYELTVTSPSGCELVEYYYVYEPDELTANLSIDPSTCGNDNGLVTAQADGGSFPFTYDLDGVTNSDGYFDNVAPGQYMLTVRDFNQCEQVYTVDVDDIPAPTVMAATSNDLTCAATTATVSGMGSSSGAIYTYQWTTTNGNIVSGANEIEAVVDAAGDYMLEVSDNTYGCVSMMSTSVAADLDEPMISVSDDTELTCTVTTVELCATVDASHTVTWNLPSGPVAQTCVTVDAADTYMAEVVSTNGCTATASVTVGLSDDQPQVSVDAPSTLTCESPTTALTSSVNGDPADFMFAWSTTDGSIDGANDQASITAAAAGTYILVVTDIATGCNATQNVTVDSEAALPMAGFTFTLVNGVLTLTNTSDVSDGAEWALGNGQSASDNEVTVTYDENGMYDVCITVSNECGPAQHCQTIQYVVDLEAAPSSTDVLCFGSADGVASANPTGGLPPYTITWAGPGGSTYTGEMIDNLGPGEYSFEMTDDFGYTESGSVSITEPTSVEIRDATVTSETAVGANDGSISLEADGGTGTLTYLWSNGATTATITDLAPDDYTCEIMDENGCTKTSDTYTVEAAPTSVSDIDGLLSVVAFPSPVRDQVTLQATLDRSIQGQIVLIDVAGKVINAVQVNGSELTETFDMSGQPAGLYFIQLTAENGYHTEKVIKLDR